MSGMGNDLTTCVELARKALENSVLYCLMTSDI